MEKGIGHEAASLAGHPTHSLGKFAAISVGVATVSNVAAYQANRKLAKFQHEPPPPLSATSGGTVINTGANVAGASHAAHRRYTHKVAKVRNRKGGN